MENGKLEQKLISYFDGEKATTVLAPIKRGETTLGEIRDAMLDIGVILEEDLDQGIYVARVTGGRRKAYGPIIAATPSDEGVDVAGVVVRNKKKPVLSAMGVFQDALDGKTPKLKRRHVRLRLFFIVVLMTTTVVALSRYYLFPILVIPAQTATVKYNEAVEGFNAVVPRYNTAASGLALDNLRGFVPEARVLTVQGTDFVSICKAVVDGNRADKIEKDTVTVSKMADELAGQIAVLEAIRNPSQEWVASKLEAVDVIDQIRAVTASDDPNGMLGKEGGYSSCTYFTASLLDKNMVKGSNPVEKGVDGGGAVEVYETLEDAQARCDYLSEFDGTILYSGSFALVGTMVIRTSCLLDNDAQYSMTSDIVSSMIEE